MAHFCQQSFLVLKHINLKLKPQKKYLHNDEAAKNTKNVDQFNLKKKKQKKNNEKLQRYQKVLNSILQLKLKTHLAGILQGFRKNKSTVYV